MNSRWVKEHVSRPLANAVNRLDSFAGEYEKAENCGRSWRDTEYARLETEFLERNQSRYRVTPSTMARIRRALRSTRDYVLDRCERGAPAMRSVRVGRGVRFGGK